MKNDVRAEYVARDTILKLLSDAEIATVSTVETASRLEEGEEYVDLEHLDDGVRRAPRGALPVGQWLAKKAVRPDTWRKIVAHLSASATDVKPLRG